MICDGPIEDPSEGDTGAESEGAPNFNLESDADSSWLELHSYQTM